MIQLNSLPALIVGGAILIVCIVLFYMWTNRDRTKQTEETITN